MPPNADQVYLRNRVKDVDKIDAADDNATCPTIMLKNLRGNEIAIEGVIYDLDGFNHPGGDIIKMYGGNEVTNIYRMMHPHHKGSQKLKKLKKVGVASDWEREWKFDTPFAREIREEVHKIVPRGREKATPGGFFLIVLKIVLLIVCQSIWVIKGSSVPLAIALGAVQFAIYSVMHDASHGSISRRTWINDGLALLLDFAGGDKWHWYEQHYMHHAHANDTRKDPDSFNAEPMVIWHNYPDGHKNRKFIHKFQAFYWLPIVGLYWMRSVFDPRILNLKHIRSERAGLRMENDFLKSRIKYAVFLRMLYIFIMFVPPMYHTDMWTAFSHTMLVGLSLSWIYVGITTISHEVMEGDRDPLAKYRETGKPVDWYKAQAETSCTYGGHVAGWLTGGVNFQIEHHLFPKMSSSWYPYIAPTVKRVCEKHGVKYIYFPTILDNMLSTMEYIHKVGNGTLIE